MLEHWRDHEHLKKNRDGYFTCPGMFSYKQIDPGSRVLCSIFNNKLHGKVADLGAGWGYLSQQALEKNKKISRIILLENDYSAYLASKKNISDKRAIFKWVDIKNLRPKSHFNHIICNPPFHAGNKIDLDLIRSFITCSSQLVQIEGVVWMVSVAGLKIEQQIKECFETTVIEFKNKHYTVHKLLKTKSRG